MYSLDVLVQGFPGRAVCHGGLGWSTIALLRGQGRIALLDVGAFGIRRELRKQLAERGVEPEAVTDVILTHAHYDHAVNFTLFPNATISIGDHELTVLPGLFAHAAPGHTPGHLIFVLEAYPVPVIFTGDSAKNRAELLSMAVDASEDHDQSRATLAAIWALWRKVAGTLLIPGHDRTMRLDASGQPEYVGERRAGIDAWFSESIHTMTRIQLSEG